MRPHVACLLVLATVSPALAQTASPTIVVQAVYPGASAQVVADTVAVPIEEQVRGVAKLLHMRSRCGHDGSYRLAITFERTVDPHETLQLVQERVNRALPMLPDLVQRQGITIKQQPRGVLLLVALTAPMERHDALYLSNYTTIQLKEELRLLPGVAEVLQLGQRDYSLRAWLNPDKLTARGLTVADVLQALKQQNLQVAAGQIGQPPVPLGQQFQLDLTTAGRLRDPKEFGEIVLKATPERTIRLKDVAQLELAAAARFGEVLLNGKPAALLSVLPTATARLEELSNALQDRVAVLRKKLPEGLRLDVAFDFTASLTKQTQDEETIRLDVDLPDGASSERIRRVLERCSELLRAMAEVRDVLALTEDPCDATLDQPSVLVRLAPLKHKQLSPAQQRQAIRKQLQEQLPDARLRQRNAALQTYPLHFALHGPDAQRVCNLAKLLGDDLQRTPGLTEVWVDRSARPQPFVTVQVDRTQIAQHKVALRDVFDTLQVYYGSAYVNDFNLFGRSWQVVAQSEPRPDKKELEKLKVRNAAGEMVLLTRLVKVETSEAPVALERLDGQPMVAISASPATGVTLAQARKLCEAALAKLPEVKGVQLTWLAP